MENHPESANAHSHRAIVEQIAQATSTPPEIVGDLYEREVESLQREARIGQFVGVIATRRVLLSLRQQQQQGAASHEAMQGIAD